MKTIDFIRQQKERIDNGGTLRNGEKSCASVFATDNRIYSYGYHYPLLFQIMSASTGLLWVCNNGGYSSTTRKHISHCGGLSDISTPIGGTSGATVGYWDVVSALRARITSLFDQMQAKKRTNTAVYRSLQRSFDNASHDLELLTV